MIATSGGAFRANRASIVSMAGIRVHERKPCKSDCFNVENLRGDSVSCQRQCISPGKHGSADKRHSCGQRTTRRNFANFPTDQQARDKPRGPCTRMALAQLHGARLEQLSKHTTRSVFEPGRKACIFVVSCHTR